MAKVLFAGDFLGVGRVKEMINDKKYVDLFQDVKKIIEGVDYSVVNLEAPIVDSSGVYKPIVKCGPSLCSPLGMIGAIQYIGFDMCALANNHILDYGEDGLRNTLFLLSNNNIDHLGAGKNIEDSFSILYKKIENKIFAFINCCEEEFSIATCSSYGAAPMDVVRLYYLIGEAKSKSDYVILITHGGVEHYNYPTPYIQDKYRLFIDFGANLIVNTHQHCISGYEYYNNGLIIYGLGNFCFDKGHFLNENWNTGFISIIDFQDNKLHLSLVPITHNNDIPGVYLLDKHNSQCVMSRVAGLNSVIENRESLEKIYNDFLKETNHSYSIALHPFKSRLIDSLAVRGLIPCLFSKSKLLFLLDMFTCSSHRERFKYYIRSLLNK